MNKKVKFEVTSGGIKVRFLADQDVANSLNNLDFFHQYIPDASLTIDDDISSFKKIPTVAFLNHDLDSVLISLSSTDGHVTFNSSDVSRYDLVTLVDHVMEYYRQRSNVFCVHGSCVSKKDKGVWLMGPISGLGKTTTALNLCLKSGFNFVADEKLLLDGSLNITGGVKSVKYNKDFLKKSIEPNLDGLNSDGLAKHVRTEQGTCNLKLGIVPIIAPDSKNIEIDKWTEDKTNFHVYEELSRKIRGVSRRVNNFSVPVKSVDTTEIAISRSRLAQKVARRVPFYIIKGDSLKINQTINSLLDKVTGTP